MISAEYRLLLKSLSLDHETEQASNAIRSVNEVRPDWDRIVRLSRLHAISPQMDNLISKLEEQNVPDNVRSVFSEAHGENLYKQISFAAEFLKIRKILADEGIDIVPFKGFWLGYDAYGDLSAREGGDVDVFVAVSNLQKIKQLMLKEGYTVEPAFRGLEIEEVREVSQEYVFERTSNGVSNFRIEFHWGICPPGYGLNVTLEDLAPQIVDGEFEGQELKVFSPSAHMLLVILHHGGDDRFLSLKQVYDIGKMITHYSEIDWEWVFTMAARFHSADLVFTAVLLASEITGIEIPEPLNEGCARSKIQAMVRERSAMLMRSDDERGTARFYFRNWFFRIRSRTGLRMKVSLTAATVKAVIRKKSHAAKMVTYGSGMYS